MTNQEFSKSAKPRVRLFLSADLIGSTALKQNSQSGLNQDGEIWAREHWLPQIVSFFSKWGEIFSENWKFCQKQLEEELSSQKLECLSANLESFSNFVCPSPWKAAGDEIIYQVELSSCAHIILAVLAWQRTARILARDISQNYRLHAWIASFPIVNSEILLNIKTADNGAAKKADDPILRNFLLLENYYEQEDGFKASLSLDFVGPSIDAGFRIGSLSSERKMIISVEMAYLLSGILSQKPYKVFQKFLKIYYDGRENLKGLLSGYGYPVFWLDSNPDDTLNRAEDRLLDKKECSTNDVKDFCLEFIDRVGNPFVVSIPLVYGCRCEFCKHAESLKLFDPEIERLKSSLKSRCDLDARNYEVDLQQVDDQSGVDAQCDEADEIDADQSSDRAISKATSYPDKNIQSLIDPKIQNLLMVINQIQSRKK